MESFYKKEEGWDNKVRSKKKKKRLFQARNFPLRGREGVLPHSLPHLPLGYGEGPCDWLPHWHLSEIPDLQKGGKRGLNPSLGTPWNAELPKKTVCRGEDSKGINNARYWWAVAEYFRARGLKTAYASRTRVDNPNYQSRTNWGLSVITNCQEAVDTYLTSWPP